MDNKLDLFYEMKDSITAEDFSMVLSYYGLEVRKGSFLCPFHGDKHFGSCVIRKDKRSAYCYACHRRINSVDLVEYYQGIEGMPAMEYLWCTILGNSLPEYDQEPFPLSIKEMKRIGLWHPSIRVTGACNVANRMDDVPDGYTKLREQCDDEGTCPVVIKIGSATIFQIYKTDPEAVVWILEGKARESLELLHIKIRDCMDPSTQIGRMCAMDKKEMRETITSLRVEEKKVKKILNKILRFKVKAA